MRGLLAILLALVLVPQHAQAWTCTPKSTQETLNQADYVFEGLPLTWDLASDRSMNRFGQPNYETNFLVKKRFKGQLQNEVLVLHSGPGAMGGIRFEIGKPVLIVAYRRENKLYTSSCLGPESGEINGGKLEDFEEDLRKFKEAQPTPVYNFPR